jgi:ElaB/YqjD/DUF883 family membrane-anchored ribosome-binding protein
MATLKHKQSHRHNNHDLYNDVQKIKNALFETSQDMREQAAGYLSDSVDQMREKTTAVKDNVANYTADKPFKSLGIALLIGAAIGFLFRR